MSRSSRWLTFLMLTLSATLLSAQSGIRRVNPKTIHEPKGYSHVVIVPAGPTVYIAGQVPLDKEGKLVGEGDMGAQTRQAFENLKNALAAADLTFSDVVNMNIYVTDIARIDDYRKVRAEFIKGDLPASTLVEVKSLFRPGVLIEISAIAAKR